LGVSNLPTNDYSGNSADKVHAGMQDPYGDLMFFKIDDEIYSETGASGGTFDDGFNTVTGTSESLIVPKPGSCNLFYIFQAQTEQFGNSSQYPHFSVFDDSLNTLLEDDDINFKTSWNFVTDTNFFAPAEWGSTDHGVHGVHFAATSENPDGERKIYISNNQRVWRVDLDCDGLHDPNWSYDLHANSDMVENGWRTELELYEDTAHNTIKIAQPFF
jgi:hypothetical protein